METDSSTSSDSHNPITESHFSLSDSDSSSNDSDSSSSNSSSSPTETEVEWDDAQNKRKRKSVLSKSNIYTRKKKKSSVAGKSFIYRGKKRESAKEKKEVCSSGEVLQNLNAEEDVPINDCVVNEPDTISPEVLDQLRRDVNNDLDAMKQRQQPTWQERQASRAWGRDDRTRIWKELVSRQPLDHSKCDNCSTAALFNHAVRCMTCKKHLCAKCDVYIHSTMPFHRRLLCSDITMKTLLPNNFINQEGNILTKDVCVPCFVPDKCSNVNNCNGFISLTPSLSEEVVVVTEQGRFLLKAANFVCDSCHSRTKATIDDYVFSGWYPASLSTRVTYLFSEEVLLFGHHISHKCPGSSKKMYAHTLEEVSKEYGRDGPVNIPLFTTAQREWETCRHCIDEEVLKRNKLDCPTCGEEPLTLSSDAIIKHRRLASAGEVRKPENERVVEDQEPRFGNLIIKPDHEVEQFRQRIIERVQTSKQKQMCGGSTFKAAREDSSEQKKYDETGLIISSCKHCIVPYAINMFKGESWTHTLFMHNEAYKRGAKNFVYDVVCQYEKWLKQKVCREFPEYLPLLEEMKGVLPIMHQKAHQLPCQILWNPRWTKGLGLTGGEEHEQVFSKLYLYAYIVKHMSKMNRQDFLTLCILYWNWDKIQKMPFLLRNKLERARREIPRADQKLQELLRCLNLKVEDLPSIQKELEDKAREIIYQRRTKKTSVDKLRRMLEGFHIQLKTVSIKVSKEAENAKARTKFRRVLSQTKQKALQTIALLNSKDKTQTFTYEDFNRGDFPWETVVSKEDSQFPTLSFAEKFHLVNVWMGLNRAKEEIKITKKEMIKFIQFLVEKRSALEKSGHFKDDRFSKGKKVMAFSEIQRITLQIARSLEMFHLNCSNDFSNYIEEPESYTEFEFDSTDEETETSSTDLESSCIEIITSSDSDDE